MTETMKLQPYVAPQIEHREKLDAPLILVASNLASAAFRPI